jgi:HK97 family phage major capsid protein
MGVQNSLGNPIFVPSVQGGALDTILGRPVVLNQAIAAAAAGLPIVVFGDLSNYILTCAQELTIYRLNERYMDTLEVGFIGAARHGGALLDAGTHPVKLLKLHASS